MTPTPHAQATDSPRWTAARLRREALYLESRHRRFELVQRGDVRQSSFAFVAFEDDWGTSYQGFPLRTLVSG